METETQEPAKKRLLKAIGVKRTSECVYRRHYCKKASKQTNKQQKDSKSCQCGLEHQLSFIGETGWKENMGLKWDEIGWRGVQAKIQAVIGSQG